MPEELQLNVDRAPHFVYLVFSAAIVVAGIWMVFDPHTNTLFRSETVVRVAGLAGIVAGSYTLVLAIRILTVDPGLELGPKALVVRAGLPPARTVDWSEIEGFSYGRGYVIVHLKSGSKVRMTAHFRGIDRKGAGEQLASQLESYAATVDDFRSS